ncbi:MAG: VCBS repeat-containing protein [Blastocatellia bacterium]|nr:VCBS repeat-containing protein [Blastocatellia bacterium]
MKRAVLKNANALVRKIAGLIVASGVLFEWGVGVGWGQQTTPPTIDLGTQGAIHVTLNGASSGDRLEIIRVADVNGDGVDDVVVAARLANGPEGFRFDAGGVFIVLGGVDLIRRTTRDLNDRADIVIHGADPNDRMGTSLAVGDVNGDGIADIIAGAPGADGPGEMRSSAGEIYVIFGGPHLTRGTIRDMAGLVAPGADMVIFGPEPTASLGSSLAVGDVNGDGIADIIAGAATASLPRGERLFAGTLHVIFGARDFASGLARDLADPAGADVTILGPSLLSFFGFQIAVGDVNGDGVPDIVASAPLADGPQGDRSEAGEVYVIFGGGQLVRGTVRDIAPGSAAGPDVRIFGATAQDLLGYALLLADVTGDGILDLVVSAIQADGPEEKRPDAGEVYIFFGGATLASSTARDVAATVAPAPDVVLYGAEPFDEFGVALAAGDLDGNGIADLMVGAPAGDAKENQKIDAGEIAAFLDQNISRRGTTRDAGQPDFIVFGANNGERAGSSIAFGDVNGDGVPDLLVGAPEGGGVRLSAGSVYIVFGPLMPSGGGG